MIDCTACGSPILVDLIVPSEVWERVACGDYALCPPCLDARLVKHDIQCEGFAFFRGKAVTTRVSDVMRLALCAWRPAQMQVERESVGNPRLYGWTP